MNYLMIIIVWAFFLINQAQANQVSLIDDEESFNASVDINKESKDMSQKNSLISNEGSDDAKMEDFIREENDKIKDIKLLNLDLERANLEFKKKEIEQKMAQLNKEEEGATLSGARSISDTSFSSLKLKLIGIFESALKKKAVLNINGVHFNVIEGEKVEGFLVGAIKSQSIVIKYNNGEEEELYLI